MFQLFRGATTRQFEAPRTVLGFYAGVLAIVEAGCIGATAVLASTQDLQYLVPWVLAFAGFVLLALIGVVVVINVIDPTKLQLSQVSGSEFIEYQRMTLGGFDLW